MQGQHLSLGRVAVTRLLWLGLHSGAVSWGQQQLIDPCSLVSVYLCVALKPGRGVMED